MNYSNKSSRLKTCRRLSKSWPIAPSKWKPVSSLKNNKSKVWSKTCTILRNCSTCKPRVCCKWNKTSLRRNKPSSTLNNWERRPRSWQRRRSTISRTSWQPSNRRCKRQTMRTRWQGSWLYTGTTLRNSLRRSWPRSRKTQSWSTS